MGSLRQSGQLKFNQTMGIAAKLDVAMGNAAVGESRFE